MRSGIDFVPLDVTLDDKFDLLEAEYGINAFAVVVKLFQKIYGLHGYYCEWSRDVALLFARHNGLEDSVVTAITQAAVKRGIFDKGMYEKYGILTSHGIQCRYMKATVRKTEVEMEEKYLLLLESEMNPNVTILSEVVTETDKNVTKTVKNVTKTVKNVTKTSLNKININKNNLNQDNHKSNKNKSGKDNKNNLNKDNEKGSVVVVGVNQNVVTAYEQNIGVLTPAVRREMSEWLESTGEEEMIWAIEEAARQNKHNWKYITGILKKRRQYNFEHPSDMDFDEIERIVQSQMFS